MKAPAILTAVSRTIDDEFVRSMMHNIGLMALKYQIYRSPGLKMGGDVIKVRDLNQLLFSSWSSILLLWQQFQMSGFAKFSKLN